MAENFGSIKRAVPAPPHALSYGLGRFIHGGVYKSGSLSRLKLAKRNPAFEVIKRRNSRSLRALAVITVVARRLTVGCARQMIGWIKHKGLKRFDDKGDRSGCSAARTRVVMIRLGIGRMVLCDIVTVHGTRRTRSAEKGNP